MHQIDFENGSITSNLFQAALPMLVAQILTLLYSIIDRVYIGRLPGSEGQAALAGIGLCFPFIIMVTAFTNLYGSGGSPLCAMARGQHDDEKASHVMNTAYSMLIVTAVILTVGGEVFARPLLMLFGASSENLPFAMAYLRIYLVGTPFAMLATGLVPYINAQGFSDMGMAVVTVGAVLNILLDPLFIFGFHMGVGGAALATILSQTVSALLALRFLYSKKAVLTLRLYPLSRLMRSLDQIRDITALGLASFIMQFTNALVNISCNHVLSVFGGSVYITTMTIISSVRQIIDTPIMAITEGASPILSYNYGARRPGRIRQTIRMFTIAGLTYTILMWLLINRFPSWFIHIFSSDPALHEVAIPAVRTYFAAFIFQALQYSGQSVFKSLGKKRHAIFFSLLRKVVLVVPLTFLFPYLMHMGTHGVFLAEPVSNFIGGLACFTTMLLTILPELRRMEDAK